MKKVEALGLSIIQKFPPETAHHLALKALKSGLASLPGPIKSTRLSTKVASLQMPNPVGLAAGFDKNAIAIRELSRAGFGFIEVGAATPLPQPGNPKPRLFRLGEDRAAINRFGFNNEGMAAIAQRLSNRPKGIPVGLNLGANKDSLDRANDFSQVLKSCGAFVDFATVNVSSPNTEKLRDLQGKSALLSLLQDVMKTRETLGNRIPIFVKISPDLNESELSDIAEVAQKSGIDGVIATNTTLSRDGLNSAQQTETGGLSGAPLFEKSTRVLARLAHMTEGKMPLIGVGGISNAEQAYLKIKAGATAVQLYTAMIYSGLSLAAKIATDLDDLLVRDGYSNVRDAVGTETEKWL